MVFRSRDTLVEQRGGGNGVEGGKKERFNPREIAIFLPRREIVTDHRIYFDSNDGSLRGQDFSGVVRGEFASEVCRR